MTRHDRSRSAILASFTACLVLSGASAGTECPPSEHGCFAIGDPGCSDVACCLAVCTQDPFCCAAAWDNACVNLALQLCEPPICPFACPPGALDEGEPCGEDINGGCDLPVTGASNCCMANERAGCDELDCQEAVCGGFDSTCCVVAWDATCAELAVFACPLLCSFGPPAFTSIACGDTICGTLWTVDGRQDSDWYQFALSTNQEVTFAISTTIPVRIGLVDDNGIKECGFAATLSPSASAGVCGSASVTICLTPGTWWFVVRPLAFDGFPCGGILSPYSVSLDCGGECVPPSCGGAGTGECFVASGAPFCNDAECCTEVCGINAFCCEVAWDSSCVSEALTYCVTCEIPCPPGAVVEREPCGEDTNRGVTLPIAGNSDCCSPNSQPGCDDDACELLICESDPYCCEALWDFFCSSLALISCPDACLLGEPAFERVSCGDTVCGTAWADGAIKDTDWYEITVDRITPITMVGRAQFPLLIGVADTGGVPGCVPGTATGQLTPLAIANPCAEANITTCLAPGTWYLFVAPAVTSGWPCVDTSCSCPDLDASGAVDGGDLGLLLSAWGTADECADFDGGGMVGGEDLGLLLAAWGPSVCAAKGRNAYTFTVTCGGACPGPTNDFCINATPIGLGSTAFSTAGATTDGPILPEECNKGDDLLFVQDVWFTYTATVSGILNITTCDQANFDTRLAAYSGSCGNLVLEACNDDDPLCSNFTSTIDLFVAPGETYTIRVGSFAFNGGGALTLTLN